MTLSHYIDVLPRPEAEMSLSQLMSDIFVMLHRALAFSNEVGIGISFPHHKDGTGQMPTPSLGNILRLHGAEEALEALLKRTELRTLADYALIKPILPVPRGTQHRVVKRVQVKSNPERLLRRSVKKGWLTEEEAIERLENSQKKRLALPYLSIGSQSTKQRHFRLLISHGALQENPVVGKFSSYGLALKNSDGTFPTMPVF